MSFATIDNTGTIRKNLASTQEVETICTNDIIKQINCIKFVVNDSDANQIWRFTEDSNVINLQDAQTASEIYFDGGAGQDLLKLP